MELSALFTMDCEARKDLATEGGPETWDDARRSIGGFCEALAAYGFRPTLLVVPFAAKELAPFLREMARAGAELGLHYHPQDHGHRDYLGGFDADAQRSMLGEAADRWTDALGTAPASFRSGNFSANDATFPVLAGLGIRQGSCCVPGRNFTRVRSNWAGAPMDPYRASAANRLVEGSLDYVEIPVTADWESVMWGGLTKLELRIEMVDARAHGFTVRKNVDRQVAAKAPHPCLCSLTHDIFDYSDPAEFRRRVLDGLVAEIRSCADAKGLDVAGETLADYRKRLEGEGGGR